MNDNTKNILRRKPIFLILLPLFFVLHGYFENYNFVPIPDALSLAGIYIAASIVFTFLFYWWYRNITKAALASFIIMAFHFFFGGIHDGLKNLFPGTFITKYSFILPASAILFLVAFIFIKKRKSNFSQTRYYLNSLLAILLIIDIALLTVRVLQQKKPTIELPQEFSACIDCPKPDIYFILLDEYAGKSELRDIFQFDNSVFIQQLGSRGFHTMNETHSNYNYTPFSVASILNMDYLKSSGNDRNATDLVYCYDMIKNNKLLKFLQSHGYDFHNYSVFDFEGQPKRVLENFVPTKTRLITSQTFLSRFDRDIRFNFITKLKHKRSLRILTYADKNNNENIFNHTLKIARKSTKSPKFIYTHLMMPHYPYYYDSSGNERSFEKITEGNQSNQKAYIDYLQYSNKKILELVDNILKSSKQPPIIVLLGDHGFRHFSKPVEKKYYFLNLSSVYLPSGRYEAFRDSSSTVNFFRSLLNSEFRQRLPYLKDSMIYLND